MPIETGDLLVTLDDGTKIYSQGYEMPGHGFVKVKIGIYSFGWKYEPNSGEWTEAGLAFTTKVSKGSIGFSFDDNGNPSASVAANVLGPIQVGLIVTSDGDLLPTIGIGASIGPIGASVGWVLEGDTPSNLESYDTITVVPDGKVIVTNYSSGDEEYPYVKVTTNIYNPDGTQYGETWYTNIGDPALAADMAAGIAPHAGRHCFPAGTLIAMADGTEKPIEAIALGDEVLAPNGLGDLVPAKVDKLFENTTQEFVRLEFDDGRPDLTATPGHRFLTETGNKNCNQIFKLAA